MRRLLATFALTSCFLTSVPAMTLAQSGFTLWSGVKAENQLPFRLDYGGNPNGWDNYRLRIPSDKVKLAIAQFAITYPKYWQGKIDTKDIELRVKNKKFKINEVKLNKEAGLLEIFPEEPVPAGSSVEIILSNVRNPSFGGMFYFNCQILSPGDVPLLRYLGTWIVNIS